MLLFLNINNSSLGKNPEKNSVIWSSVKRNIQVINNNKHLNCIYFNQGISASVECYNRTIYITEEREEDKHKVKGLFVSHQNFDVITVDHTSIFEKAVDGGKIALLGLCDIVFLQTYYGKSAYMLIETGFKKIL